MSVRSQNDCGRYFFVHMSATTSVPQTQCIFICFFLSFLGMGGFLFAKEPVDARLSIGEIFVAGEWPFGQDDILTRLKHLRGKPFSPSDAQEAAERLRKYLEDNLYPYARVRWRGLPDHLMDKIDITFDIDLGKRGRIVEITFEGAEKVDNTALKTALFHKAYKGILDWSGNSILRLQRLKQDQEALLLVYQERGYWDAKVGEPVIRYDSKEAGYRIVWRILKEGRAYKLGMLTIAGLSDGMHADLYRRVGWRRGEVARLSALNQLLADAKRFLYDHGYPFPKVQRELTFDRATAVVDVRLIIDRGPLARLNLVNIQGNKVTKYDVIRRAFSISSGDPFNGFLLLQGTRELEESDVFETVNVEWRPSYKTDLFDLYVNVVEKPSGSLALGTLYSTDLKASVFLEVREKNFALGPPWRGEMIDLRLFGQVGDKIRRVEAKFEYPRLGHSRWSSQIEAIYEDNEGYSDSFEIESYSLLALVSHPVGLYARFFVGPEWLSYETTFKDERLSGAETTVPTDVVVVPLRLQGRIHAIDRPGKTTFGAIGDLMFRLASESIGSDISWLNSEIRISSFYPVVTNHVIQVRFGYESSEGSLPTDAMPLPLRVFLGGAKSMRSFAYRSVGAIYKNDANLGAGSMWWGGVEWRWDARSWLSTALFYEMGDVAIDPWSFGGEGPITGWGIGLLFWAQNFPIRMDVGFPISILDQDNINEENKARFSISGVLAF